VFGRLDSLEGRFDSLEGRFDSLEGRFDSLEVQVSEIKEGMKNMQTNFFISQIPVYGGFALMIFMMMNK
jgi:hypothetical protein